MVRVRIPGFFIGNTAETLFEQIDCSVLGPITLATWYFGVSGGYPLAVIAALFWLIADFAGVHVYSMDWIRYWNGGVRLGVFAAVVLLLGRLREALQYQTAQADTDPLTELLNRRAFSEQIQGEIARASRYGGAYTLAYFDLDHFKQVNDSLGHDVGDQLLMRVADILMHETRATDRVARLGGDEFAVLLPAIPPSAAGEALRKLQGSLLSAMEERGWPVTFSIGAVTVTANPPPVAELLRRADALMYQVKRSSRNDLIHEML